MAISTKLLVNKFITLDQKIKARDTEVKDLKKLRDELGEQIRTRFEQAGIQSQKSKNGVTVYIKRELWAGFEEGKEAELQAALKEIGHGDMVKEKVNHQTLSAYVREIEEQTYGEDVDPQKVVAALPITLQSVIKVSEVFKVQARKS
jgi:seryl-tRNA synthetase